MFYRVIAAALALFGVMLLSPEGASAYQGGGTAPIHTHASTAQGGSTLSPTTLTVANTSTLHNTVVNGVISSTNPLISITTTVIISGTLTIGGTTFITPPVFSTSSVAQQASSQTSFLVAFASVTIKTSGLYNVKICYWGKYNTDSLNSYVYFNTKEDGVIPAPYADSVNNYISSSQNQHASYNHVASWCGMIRKPTAGTHTYSLEAKGTSGTFVVGILDSGQALFIAEEWMPTP